MLVPSDPSSKVKATTLLEVVAFEMNFEVAASAAGENDRAVKKINKTAAAILKTLLFTLSTPFIFSLNGFSVCIIRYKKDKND